MNILEGLRVMFQGAPVIKQVAGSGPGYHPSYVKRPLIGEGNAPQYWLDGQMLPFNSPNGAGVLPLHQPMGLNRAPIDIQPHTIGGLVFDGVLPQNAKNSLPLISTSDAHAFLKGKAK